jgi:DNA polymerase III subunit epsilon
MKLQSDTPVVFFDLETTGTNISRDKIVEICCYKYSFRSGEMILEELLHLYIDPQVPIPEEASKIHGLYNNKGHLENAKPFSFHAERLFKFLSGCYLGGHRVLDFDVPILVEHFLDVGIQYPDIELCVFDTYRIHSFLFPRTLAFVYEQMTHRPFDNSKAHGAVYDAKCSAEIFEKHEALLTAMNPKEIHEISTNNKQIVDFAGKLTVNKDGFVVYNFGKKQSTRVSSDTSYMSWMMNNDFTNDTKEWLKLCLKYQDHFLTIKQNRYATTTIDN